MSIDHIVCAVDGSDYASRAVAHAAQLAAALRARLTLLAVCPYVIGRNAVADLWTPEETAIILDHAAAVARENGYDSPEAVEMRARDVAYAIVDYAEREKAGLIVMGSAGKDALRRLVIGSTSMDVLRKSVCPVTIVH
ncbi:MAG: universal stress protein [Alphaproteobacteria bacterium]|nr:universal stress protein [Alphaproteobacteria bacterium]